MIAFSGASRATIGLTVLGMFLTVFFSFGIAPADERSLWLPQRSSAF